MKYWDQDSILNYQNEFTPPKEIYRAVCDSLASYFANKGFKYSKSVPKLVKKVEEFQYEIIFRSSGTNRAGERVGMEINGYIRSRELIKREQSEKGYLNSPTTALGKILGGDYPIGTKFVKQIFGETISYVEEHRDFNEFTLNRYTNVYQITEVKFGMIVNFIETSILNWLDRLVSEQSMMECLRECSKPSKISLQKSSFLKFVEMKYPNKLNEVKIELNNYR